MMELVRTWLMGITAAALIASLADSLSPEGAVKKIGKLASGLLLMVAILNPLMELDHAVLASAMVDYQLKSETYSAALESENQRLMKSIIEERASAYIQDKAGELGIVCTAKITCRKDGSENLYPAYAVIYGNLSLEQKKTLSRIIEGDLAILTQNQRFEGIAEQ